MYGLLVRLRRPLTIAFFVCLLALGWVLRRDYGVSADEPTMLKYGIDTYAYLFGGGPQPSIADWKFHSPIVQLAMVLVQYATGATDGNAVWFQRHFLTFLLFFGTVLAFYRLARRVTHGGWLPLLGCVLFVLSPRVFAHGFYNPKDVPAMFFFTLAMLTLVRLREAPSLSRLVLHALLCAILVSLRSFGLIVVAFTLWSIVAATLAEAEEFPWKALLKRLGGFTALWALSTFLVWPRLWTDPLGLFGAVADNTSRSGGTLYFGAIDAAHPWHYALVWIAITTPLLYSVLALTGTGFVLRDVLRKPLKALLAPTNEAFFLLWFWLPIAALIVLRVQIFNEWRHILFVYPALLLLGLIALHRLWSIVGALSMRSVRFSLVAVSAGVMICSTVMTAWWMIRNHPLEYAYFSVPAAWVEGRFELDYWGLSYRPAFEYIFAHDNASQVDIFPAERIAVGSALTLSARDWERLNFAPPTTATYIVDMFTSNNGKPRLPASRALHSIEVDGLTLLTIYKGPDTEGLYRNHE